MNWHALRGAPVWPWIFLAAVIIFVGGCQTVRIPAEDSTPPDLAMIVSGLTSEILIITPTSEGGSYRFPRTRSVVLLARATDRNSGIRNVAVQAELQVDCRPADPEGQHMVFPRTYTEENTITASPGDVVKITRFAGQAFELADFEEICTEEGLFVHSFGGLVRSSAENFHGERTETPFVNFYYRSWE